MVACVLFFEGTRRVVNLGPNSPCHELLNEAVKEFSLSNSPPHSSYTLTFKNRVLDLSVTLAQAGISANSVIEIASAQTTYDSKVKIALGLPGGKKLIQDNIPASTTLFDVLLQFASLDIHGGILSSPQVEQGTVMYVRQPFTGDQLKSMTLASIGLTSGSARLTFFPKAKTNASATSSLSSSSSSSNSSSSSLSSSSTTTTSSFSVSPTAPAVNPQVIDVDQGDQVVNDEATVALQISHLRSEIARFVAAEDYYKAGEAKKELDALVEGLKFPDAPLPITPSSSLSSSSLSSSSSSSTALVPEAKKEAILKALYVLNSEGCDRAALTLCLATILKYFANIINAPYDDRTRRIRVSNKAFKDRVASYTGAVAAMKTVGFVKQVIGEAHEIALDKVACTWFVLPNNDEPVLRFAFAEFSKFAELHGLANGKIPKITEPVNSNAFNPFKASFVSTGDPRIHSKQPSVTDTKLQVLTEKRDNLLRDTPVPDRNFRIYPATYGEVPNAPAPPSPSASSSLSSSSSLSGGGGGGEVSDASLLASAYASTLAAAKKEDDVPFRTKAMRLVEELERKLVYVATSIKIVFPGRVVATMSLHPHETVQDLKNAITSLLVAPSSSSSMPMVGFDMFTTPPRKSLPNNEPSPTLLELELVPAAVVFVSWLKPKEEVESSFNDEHWFLNEEACSIMNETVTNQKLPAFPTGISLVNPSEVAGADGNRKRKPDGPQKSKPGWMKL